jgi:hypothetical protein
LSTTILPPASTPKTPEVKDAAAGAAAVAVVIFNTEERIVSDVNLIFFSSSSIESFLWYCSLLRL